jgi:hypothetical protein
MHFERNCSVSTEMLQTTVTGLLIQQVTDFTAKGLPRKVRNSSAGQ